jgi:hypothetical protein
MITQIVLKNPVRTSKRTPHFTVTEINWLMLFKEIIPVYSENLMKAIHCVHKSSVTEWKGGGTYSYHWALNGETHSDRDKSSEPISLGK